MNRSVSSRTPWADGNLIAANVTSASPACQPGLPHSMFAPPATLNATGFTLTFHYDVSRDSQRFLFAGPPRTTTVHR
jgi:hypothetical protein